MQSLRINNWEKWQTYRKDRGAPPWIKIHLKLMQNSQWVMLTDAERGQLVAMWLLAGCQDGVIPASSVLIGKLCHMTHEPDIQKFIDLGFLVGSLAPTGCQLDANVTPQSRSEQIREEKKKDLSRLPDGNPDQAQGKPAKKNGTPKGTRLPHDTLPDDWQTFASKERPDVDPVREFQIFADYWRAQPGQKGVKLDWLATWRNWIRRANATPKGAKPADPRQDESRYPSWERERPDFRLPDGTINPRYRPV